MFISLICLYVFAKHHLSLTAKLITSADRGVCMLEILVSEAISKYRGQRLGTHIEQQQAYESSEGEQQRTRAA